MVLDWSFETKEGVCRAKAFYAPFLPIRVTFNKEVTSSFVAKKKLRNGFQLVYYIAEKKLCINVIDNKKQKFISLYYNGQLIREYTYNYQKYYNIYMRHNEIYGHPLGFILYSVPYCACAGGYFAAFMLFLLGTVLGALQTMTQIVLAVCMSLSMSFLFFEGLALLVLWYLSRRMRFYGIIEGAKRKRKKIKLIKIKSQKKF